MSLNPDINETLGTRCKTRGQLRTIVGSLCGSLVPLKDFKGRKGDDSLKKWKDKLLPELEEGIESWSYSPAARRELDELPKRKPALKFTKQFELKVETLLRYESGEILREIIIEMNDENQKAKSEDEAKRKSAEPWSLAHFLKHLVNGKDPDLEKAITSRDQDNSKLKKTERVNLLEEFGPQVLKIAVPHYFLNPSIANCKKGIALEWRLKSLASKRMIGTKWNETLCDSWAVYVSDCLNFISHQPQTLDLQWIRKAADDFVDKQQKPKHAHRKHDVADILPLPQDLWDRAQYLYNKHVEHTAQSHSLGRHLLNTRQRAIYGY